MVYITLSYLSILPFVSCSLASSYIAIENQSCPNKFDCSATTEPLNAKEEKPLNSNIFFFNYLAFTGAEPQ